ncbi:MAG: hypothetical protein HY707_07375 [Ignavibacteriae bacterium]|nr:hypothetical protein [Ignavibacteriota bacterium]
MKPLNNIKTRSVVIGTGWSPSVYDIVRCLGMKGIYSTVASINTKHEMAYYSRYCSEKLIIPVLQPENEEEILSKLLEYALQQEEKPILFYTDDAELRFVWQYHSRLLQFYRFLLPPDEIMEPIFNKVLFSGFAEKYHLPIPVSKAFRTTEQLRSEIDTVVFPCIVKPAYHQDWNWKSRNQREYFGGYKESLRRFDSKNKLLEFCEKLPHSPSGFVVQEHIDGRDECIFSFHGYFNDRSHCLGYFLGHKIRTYPIHTGRSAYIETVDNPSLAKSSIEYLQRVGFRGIVKIDYKWNKRSQVFNILEINPRYNMWEVLGAYAGINLPVIAFHSQRGENVTEQYSYNVNSSLIYCKEDLRSFLNGYRQTGEWTVRTYLKSILRKKQYRVFDRYDKMPFCFSTISFIVRNFLRMFGVKPEYERTVDGELLKRKDGRAKKYHETLADSDKNSNLVSSNSEIDTPVLIKN